MSTRRGTSKSKSSTSITSGGLSAYDPTKKKIAADAAPPNHPQENLPEHRTFLARSLSRNDEDMAALVDLNRTLHKVRQNIIDACGEELLLDLGEGIFILTPCGRDIMVAPRENLDDFSEEKQVEREDRLAENDDERKLLCVDFLLRMKLRRRLLNRLARRLMRVAHAMDGEDVSAPLPPKYGDLRLNIDQEDFDPAKRQWQLQEQARQRVDQFRREHPDSLVPLIKVETKKEKEINNSGDDDQTSSSNSEDGDDEVDEEDSRDSKHGDDDEESEDDDKSRSDEDKTEEDSKEESEEEESEEASSEAETESEKKPLDDTKVEDKSKSAAGEDKVAVADNDDVEMANAKDSSPNETDPSEEAKEDKIDEGTQDVEMAEASNKETEDVSKTAEDATKTKQEEEKASSKDLETQDDGKTENAQGEPVSSKASSDSDSDMFAADSADDKPNDETAALPSKASVDESNQHEGDKTVTKESEPMESSTKTDPKLDTPKDVETGGKDEANDIVKSPSKISTDAAEALLSISPEASPVRKEKMVDSPVNSQEQVVSSKIEESTSTREVEKTQNSEASPTPEELTDRKTAAEEAPEAPVNKGQLEKIEDETDQETTDVVTKDDAEAEQDEAKKSTSGDETEKMEDPVADDKNNAPDTSDGNEDKMDVDNVDGDKPLSTKENEISEQDDDKDKMMVETVDPDKAVKTEVAPSADVAIDTNETAGVGTGEEIQSSLTVKSGGEPTGTEEKDDSGSIPDQTPKPDGTSSSPTKAQTAGDAAKGTPENEASEAGTPKRKPLVELPPLRDLSQLEKDYEILKDFVDAYEKEINPVTGEVTYRILKESDGHEEDYAKITRGVGIGALHRGGMSLKEKEVEFTRWQMALLGRIPEAPTFEEIGMKNCVFLLEERRKRLRMKLEEKKRKRSRSSGDYSDDEGYKPAPKERNIGAVERKSPNKKGKDEEESEGTRVTKRMKPLPLVPYPSFYESDLRRIRLVHFDLMSTDIQNSAKDRLETATTEYNNAFQHSTKLFERKTKLEQQLSSLASRFRAHLSKIKQQYDVTVAVQKSRWQNQKAQYDANRIKKLMPTSWGTAPMGTELTSTVIQKYREGTIPHVVATCVADIVDAIEIKMTNSQVQDEPFEDFKPPPPPDFSTLVVDQSTGETMSQQIQRHQRNYQQELQTVTLKLNAAEEERKRAWKKLLKLKAEVESIAHRGSQAPPLNSSSQAIPINTSSRQQQMPSYTPGRRDSSGRGIESYAPSGGVNTSDSKYSAAKVRERIATDGSVEPISKRIGTDGLYQRPAGRSRKGMDWDAQRGVWIPKSS